jgi:putative ABC transport system substrate-binding protein
LKQFLQRAGLLIAGCAVFFFTGWAGLASTPSGLEAYDLRIVVSDGGDATKQIVAAIRRRYPTSQVLAGSTVAKTKGGSRIDVAVGPAALRTLLENGTNGVIISVFTSAQVYRGILNKAPKVTANKVSAVFAEPSPAEQFQLISKLYKRRVRVAVLVSETTSYLIPDLLKAAKAANIDLTVENINAGESPTRALNRISNATVVLAIPDSNVYNTDSIRSILDTTYRRNQAIVGFSPSMVRAGVLASAYSDVDDIVAHLTELISEFGNTGLLPMPQHPKYFQVQINDSVARSLNVVVDEPARAFSRKPGAR